MLRIPHKMVKPDKASPLILQKNRTFGKSYEMKLKITLSALLVALSLNFAGAQEDHVFFYATMQLDHAKSLVQDFPDEIQIIKAKAGEAAVYISGFAAHKLHDNILTHGPGYVYMSSKEKALAQLSLNTKYQPKSSFVYTLSEASNINLALPMVNPANIEAKILTLEGYGTRYHTKPQAQTAVLDLKADLEAMILAASREDITVRIVNHIGTGMPSLAVTIPGGSLASEYVILGGHIDSTAPDKNNAPGADDNASGIATITEVFRVLLAIDYRPQRTVEFMAFAAEEIGLVGSFEIAEDYNNNNVDVYSYVQFDMTNHNGSANDIYLMTDPYISSTLNGFLIDLMDTYNATGDHALTYSTSICNYGCSDHFAWSQQGYEVAFPFEASFGNRNPNIHTAGDEFSFTGTAIHAAKFAKLGLEYILEAAKSEGLSTSEFTKNSVTIRVVNNQLVYSLNSGANYNSLDVYNVIGQQISKNSITTTAGQIGLSSLKSGIYIAVFSGANGSRVAKKFVIN